MCLKRVSTRFSQKTFYYLSYRKSQVSNEEGKERSAGVICYLQHILGNTTQERWRLFNFAMASLILEENRSRHVFS